MYDNLLTIREVATAVDVPWRRVAVWFDSHYLPGTPVGDTSKRRVARKDLERFVARYGAEFGLTIPKDAVSATSMPPTG